jgi:hypothetical protein
MRWRSWLAAIAIVLGLFLSYRFYDQQFRLENIQANWKREYSTSISQQGKEKLSQIFSQPFHYLDRGKQSYVFVSSDKKHVLKFFDTRCMQSGPFPLVAPLSAKKCAMKTRRLVNGYVVAQEHDKDNTGLVFVQLTPDPTNSQKAVVIDRFGIQHDIDLGSVPFAIQLKATPTRQIITALLNKGDVEGAKERFRQIFEMYISEYKLGVVDLDHNVMYNTGFVDGRPIRIDVGRLKYSEDVKDPAVYKLDLEKVAVGRVGEWLGRHFPKYRKEITDSLQKL